MLLGQIKPKSFELSWNSFFSFFFFFFTQGECASCLHACLGARFLPQSYQYPNLSEGADSVDGQLCRDKECPFSGVTKSGRVWRKVPESYARSVHSTLQKQLTDAECWHFILPLQHSDPKFQHRRQLTSFQNSSPEATSIRTRPMMMPNRLCDTRSKKPGLRR